VLTATAGETGCVQLLMARGGGTTTEDRRLFEQLSAGGTPNIPNIAIRELKFVP